MLRVKNKHMSYKVFSMDDSIKLYKLIMLKSSLYKNSLTNGPGVCFPNPGMMTHMCHHSWNREAHSRPFCGGLFLSETRVKQPFYYIQSKILTIFIQPQFLAKFQKCICFNKEYWLGNIAFQKRGCSGGD